MNEVQERLISTIKSMDAYIIAVNAKIGSGGYDPSLSGFYSAEIASITTLRAHLRSILELSVSVPISGVYL